MSRELILKIKEAEDEADRIVAQAHEAAKKMVADATLSAETLCKNTQEDTTRQIEAMLDQIRVRTVAMSERVDAEIEQEVEELNKNASLRRRSVEKIIVGGLEAKCR